MIWKKNGHLRLNLVAGVLISAIFSLFASLLCCSSTLAVSLTGNNSVFEYKNTNTGVRSSSPFLPWQSSFIWVLNSNGEYNTSKGLITVAPYAIDKFYFFTQQFDDTDNSASIHAEINVVCSTHANNSSNCKFDHLDDLHVTNVVINTDTYPTVLAENVSYVITDWTTTAQSGANIYYYTNKTITFYVDIALKDLPTGRPYISFKINDTNVANLVYKNNSNGSNIFLYFEKFTGNIEFYHGASDALQATQNNILNMQLQIQQWEYEREQQEREQLQNISDDSATDGANAQAQAENRSSSVLSAITNIYGMFNNPQVTNCKIGPINLYGQMNLGELNFCTMGPIISSSNPMAVIILIGLVLLLSWSLIKTAIGLYHDLFGGKG